jgi:hypothetical protein
MCHGNSMIFLAEILTNSGNCIDLKAAEKS